MNPYIQMIIIIFYSKHTIYQLLSKIYWPSRWLCRKCVIKSTQDLSMETQRLDVGAFL